MSVTDDIKSRVDILDLVSNYATLQRSGRSYKANCPFHNERTPSFHVFPDRQTWRCFGACASGGDIFSFLMRVENLDFGEALRRLAQQAGVNIPEKAPRRGPAEGDPLVLINEEAARFFQERLASPAGAGARNYLENRGLTRETVDAFRLGVSPPDGESVKRLLTSKGYSEEQLALAGVINQNRDGRYRDMFRGRLMFPIQDGGGKVVGFGGREMDGSQPKYLNTGRTPIFDKGRLFYGMHLAGESIREKGVVIVEGYMDVITAHQHGFKNVVACMGTALTRDQAALVGSIVRRSPQGEGPPVVLALDADAAGQEATLRSLESSWMVFQRRLAGRSRGSDLFQRPSLPEIKVAPITGGKDPDEIIRDDPAGWEGLVNDAMPLMDYLFEALASRIDLTTADGQDAAAARLSHLVWALPNPFQQDRYFQKMAQLLGVNDSTLKARLNHPRYKGATRTPSANSARRAEGVGQPSQAGAAPFAAVERDPLEEHCLALMLHSGQMQSDQESLDGGGGLAFSEGVLDVIDALRLEHFRRVENREVFTNLAQCTTLEELHQTLDHELQGHLDHLLARPLPPTDKKQREAALRDCARRMEERHLRDLKLEEELKLAEATPEEAEESQESILELNERLRQVTGGLGRY